MRQPHDEQRDMQMQTQLQLQQHPSNPDLGSAGPEASDLGTKEQHQHQHQQQQNFESRRETGGGVTTTMMMMAKPDAGDPRSSATGSHNAAVDLGPRHERRNEHEPVPAPVPPAPAPIPASDDVLNANAITADAASAAATMITPVATGDTSPSSVAETYEEQHVHSVYESIASHFSSTRHKPWPFVADFLLSQPAGSVGLDVGCGNGKYLGVNRDVFIMGSDRSAALVRLARDHGGERRADVAVADGLALPFSRHHGADFVICIAVIHHLSTRERRVEGVRALLDCVRDGGKILVYVWALEQSSSRRGWDEGTDQDQLVPWVMKRAKQKGESPGEGDTTYQRYYHLYKKGELEEDVIAAGGKVLGSGYEKDNWWVVGSR
ncbi:S-adenosyl-L-methionine-dependent methyltransferase [Camillea tinctor]|nr:S-adenosyl-L-methionine-dependent methyltransferase [Camillea tinctor]